MNIDYAKYSIDQLIEYLENVDDLKYPENALAIYKILIMKLGLKPGSVDAETLGYENSTLQKIGLSVLSYFSWTGLLIEEMVQKKHEMQNKIARLNGLMKKHKFNDS